MEPMKLQSVAAKSLCIRLVYDWANNANVTVHGILNDEYGFGTCPNHDWFICLMYEMQMPPSIVIPNLIRDQIDDNITPILNRVEHWIVYHHSKHFFHDEPASPLNEYLTKFVWNADRSIDYKATARNILANSNLNPMEKFRFACTYCFVEEITKLREVADITVDWNFQTEPLLVYWSKYLAYELHTILPENDDTKIEIYMFQKALLEYNLWSPIEYFFTELDKADKLRQFNYLTNHCGKKYRKELLAKLNDEEWTPACLNSIAKISKNFAECGNFEDVRCVWRRFKDDVNAKTLARVVEELVPLSIRNSRSLIALTPLLIEIWTGIGDEMKLAALESGLLRRMGEKCADLVGHDEKFDFESRHELANPMAFIRLLLISAASEQRETFLRVNFPWLVLWQPLASVVELLEEFLDDDRCVDRLKIEMKYSPELHNVCARLLRFGEFDEFNDIIWFCWFDERYHISEESAAFFKKSVVMSPSGLRALCAYLFLYDWRRLFKFLANIFSHDGPLTPDSFMVHLIELGFVGRQFMEAFQGTYFLERKICRGQLNDLKDCINAFRRSTEFEYQMLKYRSTHALFQCLFDQPEELVFVQSEIRDFLIWSFGNEELAAERFKRTSLFPRAFVAQLKSCVDEFTFKASESMEEFLQWCFSIEANRRRFKRKMIYHYRRLGLTLIGDFLRQRRYRRCMLNWFFDNDAELIKQFKINELRKSSKPFFNSEVSNIVTV